MRKPIITKEWLADFYAQGVKPKYKGSLKRQATSSKPKPEPSSGSEVPSNKRQAASHKLQAPSQK